MTTVEDFIKGKYVVAGTGSRSFQDLDADERTRICNDLRETLYVFAQTDFGGDELVVMSGGAIGWDAWLARVAIDSGIPVVFCIPNKGYGNYYWGNIGRKDSFEKMLSLGQAIEYTAEDVHNTTSLYVGGVHMNFLRNQRMVDLADHFVVYNPQSRGTKDCVRRINEVNKPYTVFS